MFVKIWYNFDLSFYQKNEVFLYHLVVEKLRLTIRKYNKTAL